MQTSAPSPYSPEPNVRINEPTCYEIWFVLFEDDTFMPVLHLPNSTDDVTSLILFYEALFELSVDIETSTIPVTSENIHYFKPFIGRVYPNTASLADFRNETVPFLSDYAGLVKKYKKTVPSASFTHPYTKSDGLIPYYIPAQIISRIQNGIPKKLLDRTDGVQCASGYDTAKCTVAEYLKSIGVEYPATEKSEKVSDAVANFPSDATTHSSLVSTFVADAFPTESVTCKEPAYTSYVFAMKNVTYVMKYNHLDDDAIADFMEPFVRMHAPMIYQYTTTDARIHKHIYNTFHWKDIVDVDALNNKFSALRAFIVLCRNELDAELTLDMEFEYKLVASYIKLNYIITDNIDHRVKVTELFNNVWSHARIPVKVNDKLSFRNRLSGYLRRLKISKKRFVDGFCYCGLQPIKLHEPPNGEDVLSYSDVISKLRTFAYCDKHTVWSNICIASPELPI